MKLKTTIKFSGSLAQVLTDFDFWKKSDPARAKGLTSAPASLTITHCNYPVKARRTTRISRQRELWPEENDQLKSTIAEELSQ